jgi:hypothetical protein
LFQQRILLHYEIATGLNFKRFLGDSNLPSKLLEQTFNVFDEHTASMYSGGLISVYTYTKSINVRFQVLMAVSMGLTALRDIAACRVSRED